MTAPTNDDEKLKDALAYFSDYPWQMDDPYDKRLKLLYEAARSSSVYRGALSEPPVLDLAYYRAKADAMHRRAQRYESALIHALNESEHRLSMLQWALGQMKRWRNRHTGQRKRANRLHWFVDEVERLRADHDPLYRIIRLGRRFP